MLFRSTLELIRISSSCRCIVVEWSEKTVEPGRTAQLEVTYNPVGQSGTFKHEVQVFSNGSEAPLVLTVKGDVHAVPGTAVAGEPEFTPDTWTYDFGKIDEEQNYYTHIFQITNTDKAPLRYYTASGSLWKEAAAYAATDHWEEAAAIWQRLYDRTSEGKAQARLAANLALSEELKGDLSKALEWAKRSHELCRKYLGASAEATRNQACYVSVLEPH